jgi:hypothetical protein
MRRTHCIGCWELLECTTAATPLASWRIRRCACCEHLGGRRRSRAGATPTSASGVGHACHREALPQDSRKQPLSRDRRYPPTMRLPWWPNKHASAVDKDVSAHSATPESSVDGVGKRRSSSSRANPGREGPPPRSRDDAFARGLPSHLGLHWGAGPRGHPTTPGVAIRKNAACKVTRITGNVRRQTVTEIRIGFGGEGMAFNSADRYGRKPAHFLTDRAGSVA